MDATAEKPLSLPELARATGYSYRQLREWVHRDHDPIPAAWAGRQARIRPGEFYRWLAIEERRYR